MKERALEDQSICGFRLFVEKENLTAQKTYESLGMGEAGYKIYEELKENVRFLEGPD